MFFEFAKSFNSMKLRSGATFDFTKKLSKRAYNRKQIATSTTSTSTATSAMSTGNSLTLASAMPSTSMNPSTTPPFTPVTQPPQQSTQTPPAKPQRTFKSDVESLTSRKISFKRCVRGCLQLLQILLLIIAAIGGIETVYKLIQIYILGKNPVMEVQVNQQWWD